MASADGGTYNSVECSGTAVRDDRTEGPELVSSQRFNVSWVGRRLARATAVACAACIAMSASSHASEGVKIRIRSGEGFPGSVAVVPVDLASDPDPASISFRIAFNPNKLEVADVQAGQPLIDAGKDVFWDVPQSGVLSILIFGLNTDRIRDGRILRLTFNLLSGAQQSESVPLDGYLQSSSDPFAIPLPTSITDGFVSVVPCFTPAAPSSLSASDGTYSGYVRLTWNSVSGAETYAIYRNTSNNSSVAQLIGVTVSTTYNDSSAAAAFVTTSGGCSGSSNAVTETTKYWYWVRAQNICGQSVLSAGDSGYRGGVKSALSGPVTLPALPIESRDDGIAPDSRLAVRLAANAPIDPSTVWGIVSARDFEDTSVTWQPADENQTSGWVVYTPSLQWFAGEVVTMQAGASTVSGDPVEPVSYVFQAGHGMSDPLAAVAQPKGRHPGAELLSEAPDADLPPFLESVGPAYRIHPDTLFDSPREVFVPIPVGADLDALTPFLYVGASPDGDWAPGPLVEGWLAADPAVVEIDGSLYLRLMVNHGATVQLGYVYGGVNPIASSIFPTRAAAGTWLPLVLAALVLQSDKWRRGHKRRV